MKFRLFSGWFILVAAFFAWNYFFPGEQHVPTGYYHGDGTDLIPAHALHLPVWELLAALVVWYLISWVNIINEWERRPVLFFGRYQKTAGPGLCLIEPILFTTLSDIPVQDVVLEVGAESVQSKDNVNVGLTGLLTYRIDVEKVRDAVVQVEDVYDAIHERALSTIVDEAGKVDLDHLLGNRDEFCGSITKKIRDRVATWGVTVQAFEIKGFKINDKEVEQAIAMKARAAKEGEAELTRASYQKRVAQMLNEAAGTFDEKGRWLKGMEVLVELTRSAENNTVLIPTDLVSPLAQSALLKK